MAYSYIFTADTKYLEEGLERSRRKMQETVNAIEKDGKGIDRVFIDASTTIHNTANNVEKEGNRISSSADALSKRIGQIFALGSIVEFERKIIDVRSEMESLKISFQTLAGEQLGTQLYNDIKQFAATTPMMMDDLAKGAQTLLGFNIEAEKVMPILRQIGDISMGDAQKFNSLTLAFAQMSSTGKLMSQDLLQMVGAGFNPLVVIAEKTGKSLAELKQEASDGKISVEMVQDAFRSATEEGGKFYGMLEKQGQGLKGALAQLSGAIQNTLNDLGEQQQGLLVNGAHALTSLIENYDTLGRVVVGLAATYGTYRASVLITTAAEIAAAEAAKGYTIAEQLRYKWLLLSEKAQKLLNKTMLSNPYVAVATAIVAVTTAVWAFVKSTDSAKKTQEQLNATLDEYRGKAEAEQRNIDALFDKLRKAKEGTTEYKKAKDDIISQYGKYLEGLDDEVKSLKNVEEAYKHIALAARNAAIEEGKNVAMKDVMGSFADTYGKNIERVQNALYGAYGSEKGSKYLQQIKDELKKTGEISKQMEDVLREPLRGSADFGNSKTWIDSLKKAEKDLKEQTKLVDDMFSPTEEAIDKSKKSEPTKNKKYWEDKKKDLETQLAAMDEVKAKGKEGQKLKDEIQKIETKLQQGYSVSYQRKQARSAEKTEEKAVKNEKEVQDELNKLRNENAQNSLDLMRDENQREIAQLDFNLKMRLEELDKMHSELIKKRGGNLTPEEEAEFEQARNNARMKQAQDFNRLLREQLEKEAQSNNEYEQKYGSFEGKHNAITEYYSKLIEQADTEGSRKMLQKQMEDALSNIDMEYLKESIDWEDVFSEIGNHSVEYLNAIRDKLKDALKSGDIIGEDAKIITGKIDEITNYISSKGNLWETIFPNYGLRKQLEDALKVARESGNTEKAASIEDRLKSMGGLSDVLGWFSGSTMENLDGLHQNIKSLGQLMDTIGVGGTEFGEAVHGFADGTNFFVDAVKSLASGDVIGAVGGVIKGVQSWGSIFGIGGGNADEVNKTTQRLTESNEQLRNSVEKLKDSIDKSNGTKAIDNYLQAYDDQQKINEQTLEILKAQMGYHSAHHSNEYYWDLSRESYGKINNLLGTNVSSLNDIYTLTPEQLDEIRTKLIDVWNEMLAQGKYDKSEFWEQYADLADALDELTEQVSDNLTQISFDSLRDSFVSNLMDMSKDGEDFADDFSKYFMKSLLNAQVGDVLDEDLKKWRENWAKTMKEQGGKLNKSQIEQYRSEWDSFVQQGLELRDSIGELTGYESSDREANSSVGSVKGITTEQAEYISGRLTSLSTGQHSIGQSITTMLSTLNGLASSVGERNSAVEQIRNLMIQQNSYMDDVARYARLTYGEVEQMGNTLNNIEGKL